MVRWFMTFTSRVKKPSDSSGRYYDIVSTIPGDQAYRPLQQSECPFIKKMNRKHSRCAGRFSNSVDSPDIKCPTY